ncbi:LlaJI family restriction endonuclease [Adlercreutzia sp. ZJ242]|uniref:LlaJI family restriction endonuclease n=1 Tax=Adlercreutzia sp. ZJ242 TaxID=2709409 RepID=UPI0013ECB970|nr:LlaJI family restriction endonuclease [Adlercreutzia sp. ZJ242]
MRAAYFCELRPYSEDEIRAELAIGIDENRAVIDALMDCGVIRYRTGDERDEEETLGADGADATQRYQFRYVGIAIALGHAIICYPKYIRSTGRPECQMRQVLSVIRRLGQEGKLLDPQNGGRRSDQLTLMIRLLLLYDEYGVYSNYEETRLLNGPGVIDWQRTIDMETPVISNGAPIYLDLWTRKTKRTEYDLIMRLHRAILSECSRFLAEFGLSALLSIGTVELTDESPADMGEPEYFRWLIDRERAGQYVTWKQDVLDLMRAYLTEHGVGADRGRVLRLGTTSYYHAWEVACKTAFGDLLGCRLRELPIDLAKGWRARKSETLLQIIPSPLWTRAQGMGDAGDVDTLIPDTITFAKAEGRTLFCIYDAKYYVPSRRGKIHGQPGVESITKQFLYQSAYKDFVEDHGFDGVASAFLVPSEEDEPKLLASVSFPGVMSGATGASAKFSDHIDMWALPAHEVFDCYLRRRELDPVVYESLLG